MPPESPPASQVLPRAEPDDTAPKTSPESPAHFEDTFPTDEVDELEAPTLTQSGPSALSGKAPRSVPSLPRVGIPRSLKTWERYEVQQVIGAGGMGAVYKARDPRLGRFVALKIVHPMLGHLGESTGDLFLRRFQREARLQASLDHPYICKLYEIGELPRQDDQPGYPYIAMQLINGKPLHQAQTEMSLLEKVRAFQQIAEALHAAHRQGLIHRDIKPSNIIVERTEDGRFHPYVMDFGLARETASSDQTRSGVIEGTPRFMSPEQARGENKNLDRRTDIYSLGVTMYELLAGRSPYQGLDGADPGDGAGMLLAMLTEDARPLRSVDPNISVDLEAITHKCLEREPGARYDSAKELADDLGRYLDGEPVRARHIGLTQRLYRRARKHKALVALGSLFLVTLLAVAVYGVRLRLLAQERDRQAKRQAELAQRLGQEIKDMEWLLRSARQLPLHDLGREKVIIRRRMELLTAELRSYGALGQALAHYALGRAHLALHEYEPALAELEQSRQQGNDSAELYYALGLVLGKNFQLEVDKASLVGGSRATILQQYKSKYVTPAIAALQRSRAMKIDAPAYLEGLLAFYQLDYPAALKHAETAKLQAPWLYEALVLAGDTHSVLARSLINAGRYEEAQRELDAALRSYQEAAVIGQSDAEVYEGLVDTLHLRLGLAAESGKPTEAAYAAAMAASEKIAVAEPQSISGAIRKLKIIAELLDSNVGVSSAERVRSCFAIADEALQKEPGHPLVSTIAAVCAMQASDLAKTRGEDPEPLLRKAALVLEPVAKQYPAAVGITRVLFGVSMMRAVNLQLHGDPAATGLLQQNLQYTLKTGALDKSVAGPFTKSLETLYYLVETTQSEAELTNLLAQTEQVFAQCKEINSTAPTCFEQYFLVYVHAAWRSQLAGQDPQQRIARALESQAEARKRGGNFLDLEQNDALLRYLEATRRVRDKQDPGLALAEMDAALKRCLAIEAKNMMCRTLAIKKGWIQSEWLELSHKKSITVLTEALQSAVEVVQSPELYPDAWQAVAETELRLARTQKRPAQREPHIEAGLAAVAKALAINSRLTLGLVTEGELYLLRAETATSPEARQSAAQSAAQAFDSMFKNDPGLMPAYAPLRAKAQALVSAG